MIALSPQTTLIRQYWCLNLRCARFRPSTELLDDTRYKGREYIWPSLPAFPLIETKFGASRRQHSWTSWQMCTGRIKQPSDRPASSASLWLSVSCSFSPWTNLIASDLAKVRSASVIQNIATKIERTMRDRDVTQSNHSSIEEAIGSVKRFGICHMASFQKSWTLIRTMDRSFRWISPRRTFGVMRELSMNQTMILSRLQSIFLSAKN
jgi:hypothetical protein